MHRPNEEKTNPSHDRAGRSRPAPLAARRLDELERTFAEFCGGRARAREAILETLAGAALERTGLREGTR